MSQNEKDYFWLIVGLLYLVSVNNGWWWFTILLTWTLLFTAIPLLLNRKIDINNLYDEPCRNRL